MNHFLEQVFVIYFLRSNMVEFSSSLLICLLFLHRCPLRVIFIQVLEQQSILQRFCLCINVYSSSTLTGFLPFEVCQLTEDGDASFFFFFELKTVLLRGQYLLSSLHHIRVLAECCLHTVYLRYKLTQSVILIAAAFFYRQWGRDRRCQGLSRQDFLLIFMEQ